MGGSESLQGVRSMRFEMRLDRRESGGLSRAASDEDLLGKHLQAPRPGNIHPAIFILQLVDAGVVAPVCGKSQPLEDRLVLSWDRDNLFFGRPATLAALILKPCKNELQTVATQARRSRIRTSHAMA